MNNLNEKMCPLMGRNCVLNGCTLFSEKLDGCEIKILNYNLYQVKEHIRALLSRVDGVPLSMPASTVETPTGNRFPRPVR